MVKFVDDYTVLFFDADETLFDYKANEREAFIKTSERFLSLDGDAAFEMYRQYSAVNSNLWDRYHAGSISKDELKTKRFDVLFDSIRSPMSSSDFAAEYLGALAQSSHLIEGAEQLLSVLYNTHKIVIVTNGVEEVHKTRLVSSPLKSYVDAIVVSDGDEFRKPLPAIFEHARLLAGRNTQRSDILMIGDSLESDIQGGGVYGIDTCWFNPRGRQVGEIRPTFQIQCLLELITCPGE